MDITRGKISAKNGFELEQEGQEPTRRDDGDGAQREEQVRMRERDRIRPESPQSQFTKGHSTGVPLSRLGDETICHSLSFLLRSN